MSGTLYGGPPAPDLPPGVGIVTINAGTIVRETYEEAEARIVAQTREEIADEIERMAEDFDRAVAAGSGEFVEEVARRVRKGGP